MRRSRLNWDGLTELKLRWGVSKAARLSRGRQLGIFSDDQARAGYITLNRHWEAVAEDEDSMMPLETPEVVSDGLQVMNEQLGVPLSAVSRQMGVQPKLLDDLLGKETESNDANVVNLFRQATVTKAVRILKKSGTTGCSISYRAKKEVRKTERGPQPSFRVSDNLLPLNARYVRGVVVYDDCRHSSFH